MNIKIKLILTGFIFFGLLTAGFFISRPQPLFAQSNSEVSQLNGQIEQRRKEINILQKEIDAYAENIKAKQKETKSLKGQIAILENQIAKLNLDIQATQKRIEQTNLEIQNINLKIQSLEKEIAAQKEKIAEYLRLIYKNDQVSYLQIILINQSFSDFFDQMQYTEQIHRNLKTAFNKLKAAKKDLETQKSSWEEKAKAEEKLKEKLLGQKSELDERNSAQGILLLQTHLSEKQYQANLYQLQLEEQKINAEITALEKNIRKKLEEQAQQEKFNQFGPAKLIWPVSPERGITTYFHDPDYPFRYLFEHPGLDIRAYQGTPIKAPEAGYVGRIQFRGDKSYAYIMLIHNNGLSTVFAHVSAVKVKEEEYAAKGQIIGLTGGLPGSIGSGDLTTGPHLHFEVRLNGIPVNPLEYLPQ